MKEFEILLQFLFFISEKFWKLLGFFIMIENTEFFLIEGLAPFILKSFGNWG